MSRETRHLLFAALAALVALWVLARLRYPERVPTANPIPPILSQLSARSGFTDLETDVARAQTRLESALLSLSLGASGRSPHVALRISDADALVLLDPRSRTLPDGLRAFDRATGLAVVPAPRDERAVLPLPWNGTPANGGRYLLAAMPASPRPWLRPVFIGAVASQTHSGWSSDVWALPEGHELSAGTLLFTYEGELAGAVTRDAGGTVIVPGEVLLNDARQLRLQGGTSRLDLGVEVQPLTHALRGATGADSGAIVSWVEPGGPSAAHVRIGDVIEALNGTAIRSARDWQVRAARLSGTMATLSVRREGTVREIVVEVEEQAPRSPALGLSLRTVPGVGSEVLQVDAGSAAAQAGLERGDLIVAAGRTRAPSPAVITRAFDASDAGNPLLVGVARGESHHVLALVK